MATPLPNHPPAPPDARGAVLRGVVLAVAGLGVLAGGAWLGLREPGAPERGTLERGASAVSVPAAAPAAAPAPVGVMPPAAGGVARPAAPAPAASAGASAPVASPAAPAAAPQVAAAVPTGPAPAPNQPAAAAAVAPRFDIVRVTPQGGTVLAGRAAPGAEVILRTNGREIGRVRADSQGQWVLAGAPPLPPGAQEITVAAVDAAGQEIAGEGAVVAVVAERGAPVASAATPAAATSGGTAVAPPAPPLVVMTTPRGAPTLLQGPVVLQGSARAGAARLGLDIVDYDDSGEIRFAGSAPAGATVRVYVDDAVVGEAVAGADGHWALVPPTRVPEGDHRLRLDQVDRTGRVAGRIAQPFQRAAVLAGATGEQRVVVQPRQNLWRIARSAYGKGVRYTEIFAANRDQISDPARIYPGQVFAIPGAPLR